MNLELFKQQGLDLFKRFEIAVPQKKTEQALQIGTEHYLEKRFTKDGKYMLGFSNEGTATHLTIYELPSAKCLFYYIYNDFNYWNIEVLPSGQVLVSSSGTSKIMLIDIPSGEVIKAFEGNYSGDKSYDGSIFKVEINNKPFIFFPPNELFAIPITEEKIKEIYLAPDNQHCIVRRKHELEIWNLISRSIVYTLKENYIFGEISISNNSKYFIVNLSHPAKDINDVMLNTYLLETGERCQCQSGFTYQVNFTPFSQGWVIYNYRNLYAYYPETNIYKELKGSPALMDCIVCEFDGNAYLILKYNSDYRKYYIEAYNLNHLYNAAGEPEPIFSKLYDKIASVEISISPDMRTMAVYVADFPFEFYRIGTFEQYGQFPGAYNVRLVFSSNSKNVIVSRIPKFFVYDAQTLQLQNNPIASVETSAYNAQLKLIAITDSDYNLHIRSLKTGEIVHKRIQPEYEFSRLMLFNNNRLFYGSSDAPLKSWHIDTGEITLFQTASGYPYIENQRYITCKTQIVDTETLQAAPKTIPVIAQPQYYNYRDYSYPEYSLCYGENQVLVYKNDTGQLVFQLNIPVNYNNKVVLLKGKVAILDNNKITVYPLFPGSQPDEITFERGNGNILSLTKHNDSVFVLHLSANLTKFLIFDCSNGIKGLGSFNMEESTNYTQIAIPEKDIHLFCSQNKVYAFNMKRLTPDFEFPIYNRKDVYLDDNRLIIVSEQNRIDYYNLFEDKHFKAGERIATLFTIPDGFLWTIPADAASPDGWFWTDIPEYIEVMQYIDKKNDYELLSQLSPEWQKYIDLHNRKDLVMARLNNPDEYNNTLASLQGKMQMQQLQQFKHTLMLNS